MPGLYSKIKTWLAGETITAGDLNAEFDNVINNFIPQKVDDYSATVSQMRLQTDPGSQGSESQATSLAGELERLRFVLARAVGSTYWYDNPNTSLITLAAQLSPLVLASATRIDSGRIDANKQPLFLVPNGTGSVMLKAATTNLRGYINGTAFTVSSDIILSGLVSGAAFTCAVNDATLTAQGSSKIQGEYGTAITIDTPSGSAPTVGTLQAWKIVHGGNTEYLYGRYASATSLDRCFRGHLFDNSDVSIPRIAIADNDVITFQRCAYIFYTTTGGGALDVTYNRPTVSADTPTAPSSGDYWFDTANQIWKKYGSGFADASAVFLGVAFIGAANAIDGCRSVDFAKQFSVTNSLELEKSTAAIVSGVKIGSRVNVYGSNFLWEHDYPIWDISVDLGSGLTEANSTIYYLYLTSLGDEVISDVAPYDRRTDLLGYYHPSKPWRCVGIVVNDSAGDFTDPSYRNFMGNKVPPSLAVGGSSTTYTNATTTPSDISAVNVTCSGGLMKVILQGVNSSTPGATGGAMTVNPTTAGAEITLHRTDLATGTTVMIAQVAAIRGGSVGTAAAPVTLSYMDNPAPGAYTYTFRGACLAAGTMTAQFLNAAAYEVL